MKTLYYILSCMSLIAGAISILTEYTIFNFSSLVIGLLFVVAAFVFVILCEKIEAREPREISVDEIEDEGLRQYVKILIEQIKGNEKAKVVVTYSPVENRYDVSVLFVKEDLVKAGVMNENGDMILKNAWKKSQLNESEKKIMIQHMNNVHPPEFVEKYVKKDDSKNEITE